VTPPQIQPGYEGVQSRNQPRAPTVFDTSRAAALRRDSIRANVTRRDTSRGSTIRRDTTRSRNDTSPTAVPPPAMTPR